MTKNENLESIIAKVKIIGCDLIPTRELIEIRNYCEDHLGVQEFSPYMAVYETASKTLFERKKEEFRNAVEDVRSFYEEHIKGHHIVELQLGRDILDEANECFDYVCIDDDCQTEIDIEVYAEFHKAFDKDVLLRAYNLAKDYEVYEILYENVYGHEPKVINTML